jgi:hypothetical protein
MKDYETWFYGLGLILAAVIAAGIAAHIHVGPREHCFNSRCTCKHCDCVNCKCGKGERR